jgi:hypothetical protein
MLRLIATMFLKVPQIDDRPILVHLDIAPAQPRGRVTHRPRYVCRSCDGVLVAAQSPRCSNRKKDRQQGRHR